MSTIAEIGYFGGQRTCGLNSEMHGRQDMMIISKSVETLMGGRLRRGDGAGRDRRLGACADHARRQGKWVENITAETLQVEYLQSKWMQRFAKRWQLQKGTFQAGERIPQEEAKAKVSGFQQKPGVLIFGNLRTQRRPKRGTVWRSRFRDQNKTLSVKVGPENGPLFVQFADCLSDFGQAGEPNRQ